MAEDGYSLACPFLNRATAFALGVEFGMLWVEMRTADRIAQYVRTENEEQVRVAASRCGFAVVKLEPWEHEGKETGWVYCELEREGATDGR